GSRWLSESASDTTGTASRKRQHPGRGASNPIFAKISRQNFPRMNSRSITLEIARHLEQQPSLLQRQRKRAVGMVWEFFLRLEVDDARDLLRQTQRFPSEGRGLLDHVDLERLARRDVVDERQDEIAATAARHQQHRLRQTGAKRRGPDQLLQRG